PHTHSGIHTHTHTHTPPHTHTHTHTHRHTHTHTHRHPHTHTHSHRDTHTHTRFVLQDQELKKNVGREGEMEEERRGEGRRGGQEWRGEMEGRGEERRGRERMKHTVYGPPTIHLWPRQWTQRCVCVSVSPRGAVAASATGAGGVVWWCVC